MMMIKMRRRKRTKFKIFLSCVHFLVVEFYI
jgi:hypothetical protein